jgi:hypothetical protein
MFLDFKEGHSEKFMSCHPPTFMKYDEFSGPRAQISHQRSQNFTDMFTANLELWIKLSAMFTECAFS